MKIKAVIFDSSVLLNLPKNEMKLALNKIISYYTPASAFFKKYKRLFKQLQTGKLIEDEFFKKLLKDLPARSAKRIREQHDSKRDKLVTIKKDVKSVLTALSNNYKLGLISNMPREWFIKDAKRLGLDLKLFNTMIFSSDQGLLKPNNKLFEKCRKTLKEKTDRCTYITNHANEAEGASETGMNVITIGSDSSDLMIDDLKELITLFADNDVLPKQIHEVDSP